MSMNRLSMTTAVALSALALAACGSSSHKSSTKSTPSGTAPAAVPSLAAFKATLIAEKNASIKIGDQLVKALDNSGHMDNATFAATFGALGSQFATYAANLAKVQAPAKYQAGLEAIARAFATVAADVTSLAQSTTAAQSHARTLTLAADIQKLKAPENALGKAVGLQTS